jgi:hypothetical protein
MVPVCLYIDLLTTCGPGKMGPILPPFHRDSSVEFTDTYEGAEGGCEAAGRAVDQGDRGWDFGPAVAPACAPLT